MKIFSDGFFFGIAENALSGRVPIRYASMVIHHNDRFMGGISNGEDTFLAFTKLLLCPYTLCDTANPLSDGLDQLPFLN